MDIFHQDNILKQEEINYATWKICLAAQIPKKMFCKLIKNKHKNNKIQNEFNRVFSDEFILNNNQLIENKRQLIKERKNVRNSN